MICKLCGGTGSMFEIDQGRRQWWPCPACGGAGARVQYGPPTISTTSKLTKGTAMKLASIALAALLAFSSPLLPSGSFDCEIPGIPPIPPIGCADLIPLCVCDQFGNCRIVWHCVRA